MCNLAFELSSKPLNGKEKYIVINGQWPPEIILRSQLWLVSFNHVTKIVLECRKIVRNLICWVLDTEMYTYAKMAVWTRLVMSIFYDDNA